VGQPDFGCDVWKVLFEPMIEGVVDSKIETTIVDAASQWLPYISIDEIIVDFDNNDIDNHNIEVEIKFSLISNENITDTVTVNITQ
jgi:phage baseplate assembly protein W